jgi:hypothetical protein
MMGTNDLVLSSIRQQPNQRLGISKFKPSTMKQQGMTKPIKEVINTSLF